MSSPAALRLEGMGHSGDLSGRGLALLEEAMAGQVERGEVPGVAWAVARGGAVRAGAAGSADLAGYRPIGSDTIFRISSMSKPVAAVAALALVEDGVLRLDDPVDELLPELAARRVMADADGPLDDTVPARRSITLRDLLTFRFGMGMDFTRFGRQPLLDAMAELGLGAGPPAPSGPPAPDEWMRRIGTLPLERQPGERWLYHTSCDVLGVLLARAAGQPLEQVLRQRVFDPLGMRDTGFWVPAEDLGRFGDCAGTDPVTGERVVYDPVDGQWSRPPAFPSAGAGLVSTVDDYVRLASMLRDGGTPILSQGSVEQMTTDQLTDEQRAASSPDPSGSVGWGYCLSVCTRPTDHFGNGTYGWSGGLGSDWATDPGADLIGVLLTNQMWTSPEPPGIVQDFWIHAYACLA